MRGRKAAPFAFPLAAKTCSVRAVALPAPILLASTPGNAFAAPAAGSRLASGKLTSPPKKPRLGFFENASGRTRGLHLPARRTAMGYVGYSYKLASGRPHWLNADPIQEQGGLNMYGMVGNDPVDKWDLLGRADGSGILPAPSSSPEDPYANLGGSVDPGKGTDGNCASSVMPGLEKYDNNPKYHGGVSTAHTNLDKANSDYLKSQGCKEVSSFSECKKCSEYGISASTWNDLKGEEGYHVAGYNTCNDTWYGRSGPGNSYYSGIPAGNYDPDTAIGKNSGLTNYKGRKFCCPSKGK